MLLKIQFFVRMNLHDFILPIQKLKIIANLMDTSQTDFYVTLNDILFSFY